MIDEATLRRWAGEFGRDVQAVQEAYPNTFYDGEQDALRRLAQKISVLIWRSADVAVESGESSWAADD